MTNMKYMTIMILFTLCRLFILSYGFNPDNGIRCRQPIQIISTNNNVPDYEIPTWVYKEVFAANKPTNVKKYKRYINKYVNKYP